MRAVKVSITSLSSDHHPRLRLCSRRLGLSLEVLSQFPCRKWELTCLPPWVAKEEMGTLLLASEMSVPIPRNRTVRGGAGKSPAAEAAAGDGGRM